MTRLRNEYHWTAGSGVLSACRRASAAASARIPLIDGEVEKDTTLKTATASPTQEARPFVIAFLSMLIAVGSLFLGIYRFALWFHYRPESATINVDLAHAFWMGLRFDLKIMAIMALPLFIAAWAFPARLRARLLGVGGMLVLLVLNLLAIINHFYFGFFGSTIDPMVFGLFEDDSAIVVHTVVHDYPFVRVLTFCLIVTLLQAFLVHRLALVVTPRLPARSIAFPVVAFLVMALLARGTLGTFALGSKHLSVSADPFVNQIVPNALTSTALAVRLRNQTSLSDDPYSGLRAYGFRSPEEAAAAFGLPAATNEEALLASMYTRTPIDARFTSRQPHVVFALMESFGRHIMEFQGEGNDVLGRFARHTREDFLFKNVLASQHSTHRTLEALLLNSPISPLTQGHFGYRKFAASAMLPYHAAGYRTVFLTSGPASWRNIADVLKRQGFDEVYDVSKLRERFPEAEVNIRGVPDEYLFRYAAELLEEGDRRGQPVFLFLFTTNNHPPYVAPSNYRPRRFDLAAYGARAPEDKEMGRRILTTYQYAADALGGFLDALKASPLAGHTLVVAVGDHNIRQFFSYTGYEELPLAYGVPLYFYLPPALRTDVQFDRQRFASMRDIFPTLYRHSLSDACYFASGDDLFAASPPQGSAGMGLFEYVLSADGAIANLKHPTFLRWTDETYLRLEQVAGEVPDALGKRAERERARVALLDWHTRMQALRSLPKWPPCGGSHSGAQ